MAGKYYLDSKDVHFAWDNQHGEVLEVGPGDTVEIVTVDASNEYYNPHSTVEDVRQQPRFIGHPLTGPIRIADVCPGDVLKVEVLDVQPGNWGYTLILPEYGLLSDDFRDPHFTVWDLTNGEYATTHSGLRVKSRPFCGVMGVAPRLTGRHSTVPPRQTGGNMDIRQLGAGARIYFPVEVEGALFSLGDAHAAQGDGEVCTTAIETSSVTTVTFGIVRDRSIHEPEAALPSIASDYAHSEWYATTASAEDAMTASRNAVRYMIKYLVAVHGIEAPEAYTLCSVAANLHISQMVNLPHITITAFLPLDVLRGR